MSFIRLRQWSRWLSIAIVAALLSTFILQQQGLISFAQSNPHRPCERLDEFKDVQGLGKACRLANGFWKVQLADGTFGITHGNDSHVHLADTAATSSTALAASMPVTCTSAGSYRAVVLYVNANNVTNQYSTRLATIRSYIQQMNDKLNNESMIFGISSSYRVACDADGQVTVKNVPLSIASTQNNLSAVTNDLKAKGYNSTFEKYMIFWEQGSCGGGVAWAETDDSATTTNHANSGPSYGVSWGFCGATTIMHENGHNMGAVMNSAPNTSGAGHCIDDQDVMCYNDGGPRGSLLHIVCSDFEHFDCNHDDYYNPKPVAGSYIATHWNIGDCRNRFINRSGCGGTVPTNTPISATRTPTRTPTPGGPTPTRTPTRTPTPGTGTYPAWAPNTAYAVGALVSYAGLNYKCIQAHTSQVGWEPPNVPALWGRI